MRQKKRLLLACSLAFCALVLNIPAYASGGESTVSPQQERTEGTIKGRVTDASGEPILGATVRLKDMNVGTVTDVDGFYSLTYRIRPTAILVSYLGYLGKNVNYTGQAVIDVVLQEDSKMLDEVVVTGYQTISKERATGAFTIVNSEALERKINLDVTQALTGSVAGLTTYGGDVVIRGRSTVSKDVGTNPLLVIDGLPTERSIDDININDIENLTILKDAAATSIYGSRAANGVIVITTKSGTKGKTTINFTSDWKWTENPSLSDYHYASTATSIDFEQRFWSRSALGNGTNEIPVGQYVLNQNKGLGTTGIYVSPLMSQRIRLANGEITQADYDAATKRMSGNDYRQDYMDAVWRTPFRQNYTLSLANASDRQNTYASFSYTGDIMQMKSNSNETFKAYLKNTQKITQWLSVDMGIDAQYGSKKSTESFFSFDTQMSSLASYNQLYMDNGDKYYLPYVPDLSGATNWSGGLSTGYSPQKVSDMEALGNVFLPLGYNVLDEINNHIVKDNILNLRSFAKVNVQIFKDLKFTTSFDYELSDTRQEKSYTNNSYLIRQMYNKMLSRTGTSESNYVYTKNFPAGGYLEQKTTSRNNYTFRNQLDYSKLISDKHQVTALFGFEMRQIENPMGTNTKYFNYNDQTLSTVSPSVLNPTLLSSTGVTSLLFGNNQRVPTTLLSPTTLSYILNRYVSFYAAGSYGYKDLYNVSGSVRVDQTNLFGTDPKYRYRPLWSLGAGWNISNEGFMRDVDWLDMLTIRGSYGLTGNVDQGSSPYITITTNTTNIAALDPYYYTTLSTSAPNPDLRWEKTSSYALGFDFSIFKRMLSGKIEGYYKYSDDLLVSTSLPRSTGYPSSIINNGAVSNKGVEVTLSSPWLNKGGWKLTSTLLFAYNYNRVEKVNREPTSAENLIKTPYAYYQEGRPFNALYAYHSEGIKPTKVVSPDGAESTVGIPLVTDKEGNPYYEVSEDGKTITYVSSSKVSPDEAVYMGTLDPRWSGSFTQSIQYKNFELMAMFTYYGGHKIRKPTYNYFISNPEKSSKLSADAENGWSTSNPNSSLPTPSVYYPLTINSAGSYINEYWRYADVHVVDGDMVRLKNVSLSYILPGKCAKKLCLQKAKLTAQVNDLWFWCAAGDDIDPETYSTTYTGTPSSGFGSGQYKTPNAIERTLPTMTSALLRLEITF